MNDQSDAVTPVTELIPVSMLTGFLGSGKTTLLNNLVQQPEMADTLVIINEFGEMSLDHTLIAHSTEQLVMEMSSGCICCNIRGDLAQTLRDITWRYTRNGERWFRRVIIETTGLADPAPIIHTIMSHPQVASKYRLDGVISTVDMALGMHTLNEHQEAIKQAAVADALILTKADLATDEQRSALLTRLDAINPAAKRWQISNGEIAAEKLLNLGLFNTASKSPDVVRWLQEEAYTDSELHSHDHHMSHEDHNHGGHKSDGHRHHHDVNRHDDHIRAFCFTIDQPIPDYILSEWLGILTDFLGNQILRVKGILNVEGKSQPVAIHGVQHIFHPLSTLPAWPSDDRRSRLVFITHDVDRATIQQTLNNFLTLGPAA